MGSQVYLVLMQVQAPATAAAPLVLRMVAQLKTHLDWGMFHTVPGLHWHLVVVARTPVLRGSVVQSRRHSVVLTYHLNPVLQTQLTLSVETAPLLLGTAVQSSLHEKGGGETIQVYLGLH
jgi:hypothetical protein